MAGDGWASYVHPDDRDAALAEWRAAVSRGTAFEREYRFKDPRRGEYRWHLNRALPMLGEDGKPLRWFGTATDIHDQKVLEANLERRVAERTQELEAAARDKARAEAELDRSRSLEAIGRLAGGVAHDLKTRPETPESQKAELQEVIDAGQRAASLTKQLLAFGRRQMIAPKLMNVNDVVSGLQPLLRRLIGADVELRTDLASDLGVCRMDPGQVEQIILNLALNARDAMPGGGAITIHTRNVSVSETEAKGSPELRAGDYVDLTITDTGSGMDSETLAHAFEPFYTTKSREKGTGLGLATVYGIVKQNGGEILLRSAPAKGTSVRTLLPRVQAASEAIHSTSSASSPGGSETILVAEDEDLVRRTVVRALEKAGYRVLPASDGKDALAMSANLREPIDLLLTDVIMPGINGRQLAEEMTRTRPRLKVLYMSGYTEDVFVSRDILTPGIAFLEKTFSPRDLCAKVREVLDQSR
jgi:signal transduction histidine kinase/CheY-like chemotaxis protein